MAFASIFVPNFLLQAVVRSDPALHGCAIALSPGVLGTPNLRAVLVVDGNPPLSRVVVINEKAAQMGVEIGMTQTDAEQFPGIEICPRSPAQEKIAHAVLLDIGWSVSPRIEDTAPNAIVLDLSGLASLFGSEENIAAQLVERSATCGLRVNVAIAANIDTALITARGFAGITIIPPGEESQYLSRLSVSALSPSEETAEILSCWGIATCADLARLPVLELSERLGQEGVRLHALAQGVSERAIVIAEPVHSFEEEMELDDAVEELEPLSFVLRRLLDQLCARLMARSLGAAAIRVRFELQPSFENAVDIREAFRKPEQPGLYEREIQLPIPARDSKILLKLLRLRLQLNPPGAPIQKIRISADAARPRAMQGGLFLPSSPDPEKLEITIARIAQVVGEGNVGSPSLSDTHRLDNFQMRRFQTPVSNKLLQNSVSMGGLGFDSTTTWSSRAEPRETSKHPANPKILAGFRVFRPAIPAKLDWQEGVPTRVAFPGLRGEVVAASGPWRTSGDWWREDLWGDGPWQHDEWDLEIRFLGGRSFSSDIKPCLLDAEIQSGSVPYFVERDDLISPKGFGDGSSGHDLPVRQAGFSSAVNGTRSIRFPPLRDESTHSHSLISEVEKQSDGHIGQKTSNVCANSRIYRFFYDSLGRGWFVRGVYD
jgi:protein ImuB